MCLLLSNPTADEGFEQLRHIGQPNHESNLARMADEDSPEQNASLGLLIKDVSEWSKLTIRSVKKYRKGRHRFFIVGHHTQCKYTVICVMVNKRDEDDNARDKIYQKKILRALEDDSTFRIIEPPKEGNAVEISEKSAIE